MQEKNLQFEKNVCLDKYRTIIVQRIVSKRKQDNYASLLSMKII